MSLILSSSSMSDKKMIIGDMVADVYFLKHAGITVVPGGAAHAIHNSAISVIGDDNAGQQLTQVLASVRRQLQSDR